MLEVVPRGPIQVVPREEGGRQLLLLAAPEVVIRVPLDEEKHAELARVLAMDTEELHREIDRQQAAAKLEVAGAGEMPSGPLPGLPGSNGHR